MRTTLDLYTGEPFRWDTVARIVDEDREDGPYALVAPARSAPDPRQVVYLDPSRVPVKLLEELNPGVDVVAELSKLGELLPTAGRSRWDGKTRG